MMGQVSWIERSNNAAQGYLAKGPSNSLPFTTRKADNLSELLSDTIDDKINLILKIKVTK